MRTLSNSWPAFLAGTSSVSRYRRAGRRPLPRIWASADDDKRLTILDGLPVLYEDRLYGAGLVGLDLVHELHRLDDAERVTDLDRVADFDERLGARRRGPIERAHHRRFHDVTFGAGRRGRSGCVGSSVCSN